MLDLLITTAMISVSSNLINLKHFEILKNWFIFVSFDFSIEIIPNEDAANDVNNDGEFIQIRLHVKNDVTFDNKMNNVTVEFKTCKNFAFKLT